MGINFTPRREIFYSSVINWRRDRIEADSNSIQSEGVVVFRRKYEGIDALEVVVFGVGKKSSF